MMFVIPYNTVLLIKLLTLVTLLTLTVIGYRVILSMMLFITSWCKSLKRDISREIYTYVN